MLTESHPLEPWMPKNARILMLGSFPPPRARWSMDFYYPNFQNDFWRIVGFIIHGNKNYFVNVTEKRFDKNLITDFCSDFGMALYDTAESVVRLKNNASDNFLQVAKPVDLTILLSQIPDCKTIAVTGEKAADTLSKIIGCEKPAIGTSLNLFYFDRDITIWRMPSTSRAYPLPLSKKAEYYKRLFDSLEHQ